MRLGPDNMSHQTHAQHLHDKSTHEPDGGAVVCKTDTRGKGEGSESVYGVLPEYTHAGDPWLAEVGGGSHCQDQISSVITLSLICGKNK